MESRRLYSPSISGQGKFEGDLLSCRKVSEDTQKTPGILPPFEGASQSAAVISLLPLSLALLSVW